jgi:hypothetical protein
MAEIASEKALQEQRLIGGFYESGSIAWPQQPPFRRFAL